MGDGLTAFIVIISIAAVIGIVSFSIYKFLNPKLKEQKPSEEEMLKEELDRVLEPIKDEEAAKEVSKYQEKEDE